MQHLKNGRLFVLAFLTVICLGISCSDDVGDVQPDQPFLVSVTILQLNAFTNTDSVVFEYKRNGIINGISIYTASEVGQEEQHLISKVIFERNIIGNITSMKRQSIGYNEITGENNEITGEATTTFEYDNGLLVKAESEINNGDFKHIINYGYNAQGLLSKINNIELDYDVNGNVREVTEKSIRRDETAEFTASFDEYDGERNPFSTIALPQEILQLLRLGDFSRTFINASLFSQNNIVRNRNTYRDDDLPKKVNIFEFFYSDELE